jgi:tetratricopeptide (TPR) repeat protein
MLKSMRVSIAFLSAVTLIFPALATRAQNSNIDQIVQADQLRNDEKPKAAIAILEPMVQAGDHALSGRDLGGAWNVLGASYEDLQMTRKAQSCYGNAIETLEGIPTAQAAYAASLANLASLENTQGQRASALALYQKANRIYEGIGDAEGASITATNLAMVSFTQKDFKSAHRYLAAAVEQATRAKGLRDDDFAGLDSIKSAVALHDGRSEEALFTIQQAIDLWTRSHGPVYMMLGLGYAFRAQAEAKLGDPGRAIADAQHALTIFETAGGKKTSAYLRTEVMYAQFLQDSGEKEQASRLRREASGALSDLKSQQCNGCTIDARGFR